MKTDKVIGKVSIRREDLTKQSGKDQWLPITAVDADSEVQVGFLVLFTPNLQCIEPCEVSVPLNFSNLYSASTTDYRLVNTRDGSIPKFQPMPILEFSCQPILIPILEFPIFFF